MNKRLFNPVAVFGLVLFVLFGAGCAQLAPGADPVVVNAQRTIKSSFTTVDTFLKLEFDARTQGVKIPPSVTSAANTLRTKFPPAEKAAVESVKAYQASKSAANGDNLSLAIGVLRSLMSIASEAQAELTK